MATNLKGKEKSMKKPTKNEMISFLRKQISCNEKWAKAALVRIYENQTADEQVSESTVALNGIGFTSTDAQLLTKFAEWLNVKGFLTTKQMKWVFKLMPKYALQLTKMEYFNWEKLEQAYLKSIAF